MSKKGGKILVDLYNRVDQADWDTLIDDALRSLPEKVQKKFIKVILDADRWERDEPTDDEKAEYHRYVSE